MFLKKLDKDNLPKHVAITMDGNGRWAKTQGKFRIFGHENGVKAVKDTVEAAAEIGLEHLTLYAFSTENWRRPRKEISFLFKLIEEYFIKEIQNLKKNGLHSF